MFLSVIWAYAPPDGEPEPIGECHIYNKLAISYKGYDEAVHAWEALGDAGRKGSRKRPYPEIRSVTDFFYKMSSSPSPMQGSQVSGGALPPPPRRVQRAPL